MTHTRSGGGEPNCQWPLLSWVDDLIDPRYRMLRRHSTPEALVAKGKLARKRTQRTVHYTARRSVATASEPVVATPAAVTDLPA
ncbi:hypothetical protein [Streptomyces melanogenes]|uniref:Transposase n=1 Tax=Streptomyces melanogenes TaxID=67326 RepID=A0ABZ1XDC0_9ACTN|nr:hypothetical protein [Streptomyces melanogenes]